MATMAAIMAAELRRGLAAQAKCRSYLCINDYDGRIDDSKDCEPADHWQDILAELPELCVEYNYRGTAGDAYLYVDDSVLHLGRDAFLYPQVIRRGDEVAAVRDLMQEAGIMELQWVVAATPQGAQACYEREYTVNGETLVGRVIHWLSNDGAPLGYEARIRDELGERMLGYAPKLRQAQKMVRGHISERRADVAAQ